MDPINRSAESPSIRAGMMAVELLRREPATHVPVVPARPQAAHGADACAMCFHRRNCLPAVLGEQVSALPELIGASQRIAKGARLLRAGQAASRVYVVHHGAFKSLLGLVRIPCQTDRGFQSKPTTCPRQTDRRSRRIRPAFQANPTGA